MLILHRAKQAAAGMRYLEQQKIVHRDLSLRNLLITTGGDEKFIVKVADFGLSRSAEKGYYQSSDKTLPVKWSAPEMLEKGIATTKVCRF
jgi:serine/threonine protein kinase